MLTIPLSYKSGLISNNLALLIKFVSEDPLCSNDILLMGGLATKSHTSFIWNWFRSSCMATIHPSSVLRILVLTSIHFWMLILFLEDYLYFQLWVPLDKLNYIWRFFWIEQLLLNHQLQELHLYLVLQMDWLVLEFLCQVQTLV